MPAQIFLIAPPELDDDTLHAKLMPLLAGGEVPALLLERGALGNADYEARVLAVLPQAQAVGTAVLIEGDPALASRLGADGLHVRGDGSQPEAALAALKPDLIVGVEATSSRDDAMRFGEMEIDYLFFGPASSNAEMNAVEMAEWWAETMEVPSVLGSPSVSEDDVANTGCEFVAVRDVWQSADPAMAVSDWTARLERTHA